jgi:hypothetical protein
MGTIFWVNGGLQPNWTFYLCKTLSGLGAQFFISLGVEPGIW